MSNPYCDVNIYRSFYELPIKKEVEPGWFSFKWRPIKGATYYWWFSKSYRHSFGVLVDISTPKHRNGAHNGWGRSYDVFSFRSALFLWKFDFLVSTSVFV